MEKSLTHDFCHDDAQMRMKSYKFPLPSTERLLRSAGESVCGHVATHAHIHVGGLVGPSNKFERVHVVGARRRDFVYPYRAPYPYTKPCRDTHQHTHARTRLHFSYEQVLRARAVPLRRSARSPALAPSASVAVCVRELVAAEAAVIYDSVLTEIFLFIRSQTAAPRGRAVERPTTTPRPREREGVAPSVLLSVGSAVEPFVQSTSFLLRQSLGGAQQV